MSTATPKPTIAVTIILLEDGKEIDSADCMHLE